MEITTVGELLHWSYSNLAMAHSAITAKAEKYGRTQFECNRDRPRFAREHPKVTENRGLSPNSSKKSSKPEWVDGAIFPLLGELWQVRITTGGEVQMVPATVNTEVEETQLKLPLPSMLTAQQIEKTVMDWYRHHAMACFRTNNTGQTAICSRAQGGYGKLCP